MTSIVALARGVSPRIAACELTFMERTPIDAVRAADQHAAYRRMLVDCGARVLELPADAEAPDCCFVEDTAVVLDEIAVMTTIGAPSRRREGAAVEAALAPFRRIARIAPPATLDGGDVVVLGRRVFVGRSARTSAEGVRALEAIVSPFDYEVVPVAVSGILHLKTAVTAIDDGTLMANPAWLDLAPFRGLEVVPVPAEEPWAGNVLRIGRAVGVHAGHPRTIRLLRDRGLDVRAADVSELMKAEAAMTCLSILFRDTPAVAGAPS